MIGLNTISVVTLNLLLICNIIYCQNGLHANTKNDPEKYCQMEKECVVDDNGASTLHIGCPDNYKTSKSYYKLLRLKYKEREFVKNELNQFRSDVALGEKYSNVFSSGTFSYMQKLQWNYELEKLLQLMIVKHSNTNFYCIATSKQAKPIQLFVLVDRPQSSFSLEAVFSIGIKEIISKAVQSYSLATKNEVINWSQTYHPDSWAFACAVGEVNATNSNNKILLRCAFYGKRIKKSKDEFKFGELCSGCKNSECSDLFPGLCGNDLQSKHGESGDPGLAGPPGLPGNPGAKGNRGNSGIRGFVGLQGNSGEKGEKGNKGDGGTEGAEGIQGEKGILGVTSSPDKCPGAPGFDGLPGIRGMTGLTGVIGIKGEPGEFADFSKGAKGKPGSSVKGEKGEKGKRGLNGLVGNKGYAGEMGEKGDHISNINVRFDDEDECLKCTPGEQGIPGPVGEYGLKGEPAILESPLDKPKEIQVTTRRYD